jgi:hypothetical protein
MTHSIGRWFVSFLLVALVSVWLTTPLARASEIEGTWLFSGSSRLKVKKIGKFGGATAGSIKFSPNGRFEFELDELLKLRGDFLCAENSRKVLLTLDPELVEPAILSFLEPSIFQVPLRGVEPGTVKLKVKLKKKKGEDIVKVRFKMKFDALLALLPEDPDNPGPEVVQPFRMTYRYKGQTILPE